MRNITLAVLSIASAFGASCALAVDSPRAVTVHELVTAPESFNGAYVHINGCAFSSPHATSIYDCSTPDAPGVILMVPEGSRSESALQLITYSYGPEVASGDRRVSASIFAHFQWRQSEKPNLLLVLDSVSNLAITDEP